MERRSTPEQGFVRHDSLLGHVSYSMYYLWFAHFQQLPALNIETAYVISKKCNIVIINCRKPEKACMLRRNSSSSNQDT